MQQIYILEPISGPEWQTLSPQIFIGIDIMEAPGAAVLNLEFSETDILSFTYI